MPSGKVTSGGCPLFTGKVFKDYLDGEFRMFLRRLGIARVLDPSKNPRELYELPPDVPPLVEQAPATAVLPTPRTTRRGSVSSPSSTSSPVSEKDRLAHQRLVQSVRAERMKILEKYEAWDADCEEAHGHLFDATPAEARRRVARETVDDLQVMIRVLSDHYKTRTMFERMQLLIEFITSSINPALDAEQQVDVYREYLRVLTRSKDAGDFGTAITVDDLGVCVFLLALSAHGTFDNFVEDTMKEDEFPSLTDCLEAFLKTRSAKPGPLSKYVQQKRTQRLTRFGKEKPEAALSAQDANARQEMMQEACTHEIAVSGTWVGVGCTIPVHGVVLFATPPPL